jgi:hypothetical protein
MYYQQIIVIDIRLLCKNNFEYFKSYQDDDQGWDQKKMSGFGRPEMHRSERIRIRYSGKTSRIADIFMKSL